ncbi:SBBP repeat-containing protein [candidate division WOR-3 bacterium]|nr:SBBP repeat-containing protein [candidate division WOR-3 bacterium]
MKKWSFCCLLAGLAATGLFPNPARADGVDTVWVRRYAQPGYCNDEATAMVVDPQGNVYVTGSSQRYESGPKDFATVKYSAAGVKQWAARYEGPGNSVPSAIAVDGSGNVYVTGAGESTGTSWDFLTVKYNSAGAYQWHDRYNGPASGEDRANSICTDPSGVAVCGWVAGGATSNDWTIVGYTTAGGRRFITPRTSAGGNPDEANCIVSDPSGNYYVAGRLWYPDHVDDAVVAKYSPTGAEQWAVPYHGPLSGDGALAICRSSASGDLYATGWSVGPNDNTDILMMKVTAAGSLSWTARYASPENTNDLGMRIAVDATGNPRVLGRVQVGPGGDYDLVTLGYRSDSAVQFINRLGTGGYCAPGGIAVGPGGEVFSCGSLNSDWVTLRYDGGAEVWRRFENWGSGDAATAIGLDDSGYVYVTGRGDFGANAWDFVTIKYNPNAGIAEERWTPVAGSATPTATVVRGVLNLTSPFSVLTSDFVLLDASGREVLSLTPGVNDISSLAPGVYFVQRARSGKAGRVLVTR